MTGQIQYNHRMPNFKNLAGVYAAAITPLTSDQGIDLGSVPSFLAFLAGRGCHGALILGTTGEGPSMGISERLQLMRAALEVRQTYPDFRLLAGTGTPSLEDTRYLTEQAFDLGYEGVVVLPPYYFKTVPVEGLFQWYGELLRRAVPGGGALFGYHIPAVSGVDLSIELLERLKDAYPERFAGLKDSSGDLGHAQLLGAKFGQELVVLNGNDRLLSAVMQAGASGCITALANIGSPLARQVYDAVTCGQMASEAQDLLTALRAVLDHYPPAPPFLKPILRQRYGFPHWDVRLPLLPLPVERQAAALAELDSTWTDG